MFCFCCDVVCGVCVFVFVVEDVFVCMCDDV